MELNRWSAFGGGLFRYLLDPFGGEIWCLLGLFGGWGGGGRAFGFWFWVLFGFLVIFCLGVW